VAYITAGAELLNLLVIDDEKSVRESCRDAAQINGFNTLAAGERGTGI
jgi:hypothetical protein